MSNQAPKTKKEIVEKQIEEVYPVMCAELKRALETAECFMDYDTGSIKLRFGRNGKYKGIVITIGDK
jgi:hypothetical protein